MQNPGIKTLRSLTPIRVNDLGGWTDTWFAGEGKVLNIAVRPRVNVEAKVFPNATARPDRLRVHAADYGTTFRMDPDRPTLEEQPFLQAALSSLPVPPELEMHVTIRSGVPGACSTGTSGSVCVALLGLLNLLQPRRLTPQEIAERAHRVETEKLGLQSGIQDQLCAAFGGVSFIHMTRYPRATVETLALAAETRDRLEKQLCLIFLGRAHSSSALHEQVIASLEREGSGGAALGELRALAEEGRAALLGGDLEAFGEVMRRNNACQKALHEALVSGAAEEVIATAARCGALGWKVNGAGGAGGSLTLLASPDGARRNRMLEEICKLGRGIRPIPIALDSKGLEAWVLDERR